MVHRNSVASNDYKIQIRAKARGCPLRFGFNCSNTCSHDYRHQIVLPRSQFSSPDRQIQSKAKQHKIPQFRQHLDSKSYRQIYKHFLALIYISWLLLRFEFRAKLAILSELTNTSALCTNCANSPKINASCLLYVRSPVLQYGSDPAAKLHTKIVLKVSTLKITTRA